MNDLTPMELILFVIANYGLILASCWVIVKLFDRYSR